MKTKSKAHSETQTKMIHETAKIWPGAYVYDTATIGKDVSVGRNTEIGPNVWVGPKTRIGAQCFLPEGVRIGAECFIGPAVVCTNDRYPPSPRSRWEITIIEDGAAVGAGVIIMCGVKIGRGALIGCGSVVTKSVPAGEVWAGVPAKKIRDKRPCKKSS